MKKLLFLFPLAAVLALAFLGSTGCATIVPPMGGPRDSLPPRLVKAVPGDSAVNFRGNTITFTFDEYIDYAATPGTVLFTPTFEQPARIEAHLRTLTVRIKDTLEPNTTYSFNFGDAIKDINESNILRGFTYTFSTGPYLDSLTLSGQVVLAETGAVDSTISVFLYRNLDDSAVAKERPRYITRLNNEGRFTFHNLPAGTFAVYAVADPNGLRRYNSKTQFFGFLDSPLVVRPGTPDITLHAYQEVRSASNAAAAPRPAAQPATDRRLRYNAAASGGQDLQSDFRITFDNKVTRLDTTKMRLTVDSTYTPVAFRALLDSTRRIVLVQTKWQAGAEYQLLLDKDFATDSTGRSQLRTDTVRFTARSIADYGRLQLRFRNVDPKLNPVLQFVLNDAVVFSAPISSGVLNKEMFAPGDYELRVLYDRNGNGTWDAGRFFEGRRQPELVRPIGRTLTVKPDIDTEVEIALPDPNGPVTGAPAAGTVPTPAPANNPAARPAQTPTRPNQQRPPRGKG